MESIKKTLFSRLKIYIARKWNSEDSGGSIFKNMMILASGVGAARVLTLFTAPIVTRIYQPDDFGVLSFLGALAGILVPFGTLRYSMAIPLPEKDGVAVNLTVLSVFFLLLISGLIMLFFLFFAPNILGVFSMEKLLPYWWLLPITTAGTGFYELLQNWALREKAFKPLARTGIWQTVVGAVAKISLGLLGFKPLGLLIGQVLSQTAGILTLMRCCYHKIQNNFRHVTKARLLFLLRRYADFPKYRLPSQFLLAFSSRAPILFFSWQFGAEVTGQLGLALTMLALPMTLFGKTISQAYYAEIAKIGKKNPEKIYLITKSITKKLFLLGLVPFFILLLGGPWLFETFFGAAWREAGVFCSILSIYLLAQFVSSPLMNVLNVLEQQNTYLKINIYRFSVLAAVFFVSKYLNLEYLYVIEMYSIVLSFFYISISFLIFKMIR